MTALRMEVFALACQRRTKNEDLAVRQSFLTRRYLEENAKLDIWRIMGEYNQAIADSATSDKSGQITNPALVLRINNLRYDMMEKWLQANIPNPESPTQKDKVQLKYASRAGNRIGADMRQADCVLAKLLALRLAHRLGCNINIRAEALFRLAATIFGFYNGAEEYLKSVNLQVGELPRS
jgi:ABC-type microcin C transport system permease subunit YejE